MTNGPFDANNSLVEADYALLERLGFNMLRLGTMWPGVMPTAGGGANVSYLAALQSIASDAAAHGIYSLLDMHQDLLSPFFCGEGAPDWAVHPAGGVATFPLPVAFPYKGKPHPSPSECAKRQFGEYYMSAAVGKAFQQLYDNVDGFQGARVVVKCGWAPRLTMLCGRCGERDKSSVAGPMAYCSPCLCVCVRAAERFLERS